MTAIISVFTTDGFVIGADGRSLDSNRNIVSECSQKLFAFRRAHVSVVYAWCGTTHVMNESGNVLLDLNLITYDALKAASQSAGKDFPTFIQLCCNGIYGGICRTPVVKKITNSDVIENDSKARMLLNGYFKDVPFTAEFYLREKDRITITAKEIHFPIVSPTRNFFSGCGEQNKKYLNMLPTTTIEALKLVDLPPEI